MSKEVMKAGWAVTYEQEGAVYGDDNVETYRALEEMAKSVFTDSKLTLQLTHLVLFADDSGKGGGRKEQTLRVLGSTRGGTDPTQPPTVT